MRPPGLPILSLPPTPYILFSQPPPKINPQADGSERPESSCKWYDGSVEKDLPMEQLAELFNINHFLVSQVRAWMDAWLRKGGVEGCMAHSPHYMT